MRPGLAVSGYESVCLHDMRFQTMTRHVAAPYDALARGSLTKSMHALYEHAAQSEVLAAFLDDLGARMRDAKSLAAAQCKPLRLEEKVVTATSPLPSL